MVVTASAPINPKNSPLYTNEENILIFNCNNSYYLILMGHLLIIYLNLINYLLIT